MSDERRSGPIYRHDEAAGWVIVDDERSGKERRVREIGEWERLVDRSGRDRRQLVRPTGGGPEGPLVNPVPAHVLEAPAASTVQPMSVVERKNALSDALGSLDRLDEWVRVPERRGAAFDWMRAEFRNLRVALRTQPLVDSQETRERLNGVYAERANVVALAVEMARRLGYPIGALNDANEPGWVVVYIELPTGQVSWHYSADDFLRCFPRGLLAHERAWDSHDTATKYARCAALHTQHGEGGREEEPAQWAVEVYDPSEREPEWMIYDVFHSKEVAEDESIEFMQRGEFDKVRARVIPLYRRAPVALEEERERIAWVRNLTLIAEDAEIRPAAMSIVRPSEYQKQVNALLDRLLRSEPRQGDGK